MGDRARLLLLGDLLGDTNGTSASGRREGDDAAVEDIVHMVRQASDLRGTHANAVHASNEASWLLLILPCDVDRAAVHGASVRIKLEPN